MSTQAIQLSTTLHVLGRPDSDFSQAKIAADGGPYTLTGSTAHFQVYYENILGAHGAALASAALAACEADYNKLKSWFGGITPQHLPFQIYVVTGVGGAYHDSCTATGLHCGATATTDAATVNMLVVAEEDEVFMANQGHWDCGASTGEGLSRVLATELYPSALDGFTSAASWLDAPGRPDFITNTDPTDRNYPSIGCTVLFLNWLRYQFGFSWDQIIAAGAPTLAQMYTNITGGLDALARFKALMQAVFPTAPSGLTNDNPFPVQTQSNWRWCNKCQGLAFAGASTLGPCPAGGEHDHTGSGNYALEMNVSYPPVQFNWRWCNKCQGLSFAGGATPGNCPNGGTHDHTGSGNYALAFSGPGVTGQATWRWCNKCQGLSFAGGATPGNCPNGGTHDHTGSGDYTLALNAPAGTGQSNWRWCNKCQGLSFAGGATPGNCPNGGTHDHTGSGNYSLPSPPAPPLQSNWRWCNKCQGLAFAGASTPGPCPVGGEHDHTGSGDYSLVQNASAPIGQDNWRWCNKCQGLAFAGTSTLGPCPAGGEHDHTGSGDYSLHQV